MWSRRRAEASVSPMRSSVMAAVASAMPRSVSSTNTEGAPNQPVGAGNSVVVVDLPRWGPMLSPRVTNLVPIPSPRMERETPGRRPRPHFGHSHHARQLRAAPTAALGSRRKSSRSCCGSASAPATLQGDCCLLAVSGNARARAWGELRGCRLAGGGIAGQRGQSLAVAEAEIGPAKKAGPHVVDCFLFGVGEGDRSSGRGAEPDEALRFAVGLHRGVRVGPVDPFVDQLLVVWAQMSARQRRRGQRRFCGLEPPRPPCGRFPAPRGLIGPPVLVLGHHSHATPLAKPQPRAPVTPQQHNASSAPEIYAAADGPSGLFGVPDVPGLPNHVRGPELDAVNGAPPVSGARS